MKKYKVEIIAIWFDEKIGLKGAYGVILKDGTPVYLCSREKMILGAKDSIRNICLHEPKIISKIIFSDIDSSSLKKYGLMGLTVPDKLKKLALCKD